VAAAREVAGATHVGHASRWPRRAVPPVRKRWRRSGGQAPRPRPPLACGRSCQWAGAAGTDLIPTSLPPSLILPPARAFVVGTDTPEWCRGDARRDLVCASQRPPLEARPSRRRDNRVAAFAPLDARRLGWRGERWARTVGCGGGRWDEPLSWHLNPPTVLEGNRLWESRSRRQALSKGAQELPVGPPPLRKRVLDGGPSSAAARAGAAGRCVR